MTNFQLFWLKRVFFKYKTPWGANENFLVHTTSTKSFRPIISSICEKNNENLMHSLKDIAQNDQFSAILAKKGVLRYKTPPGG